MFEALGYFVEKLIRVRVGPVELGRLALGEIRPLLRTEIIKLKRAVGLETDKGDRKLTRPTGASKRV
jgi:16S rRNA U516 pseudouridylate synthase RsuA-like enzyme